MITDNNKGILGCWPLRAPHYYQTIKYQKIMSNWAFNTIKINGKNEDIEKFLSDASKYEDGTIRFSSWIPVPDTFKKYDTTNFPNGERLEIGKPVPLSGDNAPIVTQELIDEYIAATKLQMEQYGVVGWYDYNCKTYGCKWDSRIEIESQFDGELTLSCETPWSPPNKFFLTMSERYPELIFNMASDSVEGGYYIRQLFEKGTATKVESGKYYDGEYIGDDVGPIKRWMIIKWISLKYEVETFPYVFRYRIEHLRRRFKLMLGMIKPEPVREEDELPF